MLVLGGTGRLYGALVGAAVFMIAQDYLAGINPVYWQFWLGLLLVVLVLFARGGILGGLERLAARAWREAGCAMAMRAAHRGPVEAASARSTPTSDVSLDVRARRAPRADRPERRRQDDVHQPADRRARADAGDVFLGDEHITALPQHERVKRGMTRTFQINTLFPGLTVLESVVLARLRAQGERRRLASHRRARSARPMDEASALLRVAAARRATRDALTRNLPTASSACSRSRSRSRRSRAILLLDEPAAGIPSGESAELFGVHRSAAARRDHPVHRARHGPRVPLRRAHHGAGRRAGC